MSVQENINNIQRHTHGAQLIVVTKKQDIDHIKKVYKAGEKNFGENRVNELLVKKDLLPMDIKWHMIGHLQTNKVKFITPFIYMIQSVDSIKLLNKINECGKQDNRIISCLIQIKITQEDTKYGFSIKESSALLKSDYKKKYPYVNIKGIMGMASLTHNKNQIEAEFRKLKKIHDRFKHMNSILSIGMSNDYGIAHKVGSNMIRIGSSIFKEY